MRTPLLASLASIASIASIATIASLTAGLHGSADACGPYGGVYVPRVFQLTTHSIKNRDDQTWSIRSFALLAQAPQGSPAWRQIAPYTYDYTMIADAPDLETPTELTLVGPSGTRVVSTRSRVFLKPALGWDHTPTAALEVTAKRGEFSIALAGRHTDTKWMAMEGERNGTAADIAWVRLMTSSSFDGKHVYVSKVTGTDVEIVSVLHDGKLLNLLRRDRQSLGQFTGRVHGAITYEGRQFVVQSDGGATRALRIR